MHTAVGPAHLVLVDHFRIEDDSAPCPPVTTLHTEHAFQNNVGTHLLHGLTHGACGKAAGREIGAWGGRQVVGRSGRQMS